MRTNESAVAPTERIRLLPNVTDNTNNFDPNYEPEAQAREIEPKDGATLFGILSLLLIGNNHNIGCQLTC